VSRWLTAPVAVACGLLMAPLAAHPVLSFAVASHKESPAGLKSSTGQAVPSSDERFALTVTLGHQYLIVEARGARTIYDFARQRILRLNLTSKTYTDDSLYMDIAFRAAEFQNRLRLGAALQAAKLDAVLAQVHLTEQLFSLTDPKHPTDIDEHHSDGQTLFSWQDHKLVSVSDKTRELPPSYQSEYWRFLRYYAGGHPKIYAALASVQGVPDKITFVLPNLQAETREIALNGIHVEADAPYSLDGFTRTMPDQAPYSTLKLLGPNAAAQLAQRVDATVKDRNAAFSQGHVLDALLANMALSLMTGSKTDEAAWMAQHRDSIQSDESARLLTANLNPRDQASAKSAVQTLAELREQPGPARYVLDVFQGNTLLGLRNTQSGEDHLLMALTANPFLLGAWSDLGGYYYQTFQTDKAWACWDAARSVSPQHAQLLPITQLEERLRMTFPEFF